MGYFGFRDEYGEVDQQQADIAARLQENYTPVTSFKDAVKIIGQHIYAKYKYFILNRQVDDKRDYFEDKKQLLKLLPGIDSTALQIILDEMYNHDLIRKDDGVTVFFTSKYIYSTTGKAYFAKL